MAKKKVSAQSPRPARTKAVPKVWRVFRFEERFELSDDVRYCRRTPLQYIREYVGSGQDDESIAYKQQLAILRSRPNRAELFLAFYEIRENAANRSRCYRGYLLDESFRPASEKKISLLLKLDYKVARRVLKELAEIGLIERVPVPDFDLDVNTPPPQKSGNSGRARKKTNVPGNSRSSPGAFKKKEKEKEKKTATVIGKSESKKEKKTAIGKIEKEKQAEAEAEAEGKAKTVPKGKIVPKTEAEPQAEAEAEAEGRAEKESHTGTIAQQAPTATPPSVPTMPTVSDSGEGADGIMPRDPPQSVFNRATSQPGVLRRSVAGMRMLHDPAGREYALKIYKAICVPYPESSTEGIRELTSFASAWLHAKAAGLTPAELESLWHRTIKDAEVHGRKRKIRPGVYTKSPEAVWWATFKSRLKKLKQDRIAL